MNFTNLSINNTIQFFDLPKINSYENVSFFHMLTTGHFWRNTSITELSVLHLNQENKWIKKTWTLEHESDEYDMLEAFTKAVSSSNILIGFNSTSFHIPYLEHKYKAYGLPSPFTDKTHIDLLKEIKPIGKQLHISTKLNDLRIFLHLPDELSEIECIAASTSLFQYETILNGGFSVEKAELSDKAELLFFCKTDLIFPSDIRIHDDDFYLIGTGYDLRIKVKMTENRLKMYYSNYKDYYYLPEEDMIIHKSLAVSIQKDKKIKSTPDNCFSYIEYSDTLAQNTTALKKYLTALLQHYKNI